MSPHLSVPIERGPSPRVTTENQVSVTSGAPLGCGLSPVGFSSRRSLHQQNHYLWDGLRYLVEGARRVSDLAPRWSGPPNEVFGQCVFLPGRTSPSPLVFIFRLTTQADFPHLSKCPRFPQRARSFSPAVSPPWRPPPDTASFSLFDSEKLFPQGWGVGGGGWDCMFENFQI